MLKIKLSIHKAPFYRKNFVLVDEYDISCKYRYLNDDQNVDIFATLESYTLNDKIKDNFFISYCRKIDLNKKELGSYDKTQEEVGYEGIQFDGYKLFTHATGDFIHEESQTSWYNSKRKQNTALLRRLTPSLKPTLRSIGAKFELSMATKTINFGPVGYDSTEREYFNVNQYFLFAKQFFHYISKDQSNKDKISSKFKLNESIITTKEKFNEKFQFLLEYENKITNPNFDGDEKITLYFVLSTD